MQLHTETEYNAALAEFLTLAKESQTAHRAHLLVLRDALDAYEVVQGHEPAPPATLAGRLEVEMYKLRMKQKQFAALLGITETRLSEVLNGKRAANLDFVKRLHTKLNIPGDELLALV